MKKYLALFILLGCAGGAFAQNPTAVTGTITDPNGIAYYPATVTAKLTPVTTNPTVNGRAVNPNPGQNYTVGPVNTNSNGSFAISLFPNSAITPASTQWVITVSSSGSAPPAGLGPQTFSVTVTISGSSQIITSTLDAAAQALLPDSGNGGGCAEGTCIVNAPTADQTITGAHALILDGGTFSADATVAGSTAANAIQFSSNLNIGAGVPVGGVQFYGALFGLKTLDTNPNNFSGGNPLNGIYSLAYHQGSGTVDQLYGHYVDTENTGSGTINKMVAAYPYLYSTSAGHVNNAYGSWVFAGDVAGGANVFDTLYGYAFTPPGAGSTTGLFANWSDDLASAATNGYYSWWDSRGVRRVKEDATFDSVGQAIEALYNPQFTKYTPGAANYERVVLGQWSGNVAQIGTEAGGTGTPRKTQIIGPGFIVPDLETVTNCANGASPAVCASAPSGAVAVPTGVNPTLVVNTTKVTAASRIFLSIDESLTIAATTCNTSLSTLVQPVVTARTAGTSFTIQIGATIAVNPACVSYFIVN